MPSNRREFTALTLGLGSLIIMPNLAQARPLAPFQWQYRPLVVFAPGREHADYKSQIEAIEQNRMAFDERDMLLVSVLDRVELDATPPPTTTMPASAGALRQHYRVEAEEFTVILVGKDGGEKGRWESPITMDEVFATIDTMPMRQREMQR